MGAGAGAADEAAEGLTWLIFASKSEIAVALRASCRASILLIRTSSCERGSSPDGAGVDASEVVDSAGGIEESAGCVGGGAVVVRGGGERGGTDSIGAGGIIL